MIFVLVSTIEYFVTFYFLDGKLAEKNLQDIWDNAGEQETEDEFALHKKFDNFTAFKEYLAIPLWVEIMNALSQALGFFTVIIVVWQIWAKFVLPTRRAA